MKICLIVFRFQQRVIETQNKIDVETNSISGQSSKRLGVEILYKKHNFAFYFVQFLFVNPIRAGGG